MCKFKMQFSRPFLNILDLCRLCLSRESSLIPVFDSSLNSYPLWEKINVCLTVEIKNEDKVSQKICESCLNKVNAFYEFRSSATENQKELLRWLDENDEQLNKEILDEPSEDVESSVKDEFKIEENTFEDADESDIDYDSGSESESSCSEVSEGSDGLKLHKINDEICQVSESNNVLDDRQNPGPSMTESQNLEQPQSMKERRVEEPVDVNGKSTSKLHCNECSLEFRTRILLKNHIKDIHSSYSCHCGAKFMSARYLARHEARHTAKPDVPCKICNKLFITKSEMKDHQKSHQVGEKLYCHMCDYVSLYKSNMARHLKRHNKEYAVFCDSCNEGFFGKDELNTHQIKKHGATPYFCTICSKSFTSKSYLNEHNKTMHFITSKDFLCETCGKAFKTKTATKRHMKIHLGMKYKCHMCNKSVNSPYSLKKHIKAHLGEKNVVCYICGKAFVDNKYMAAHLRSHTGERPYGCKECGKRFTQPTTLKVHLRYHTGERPYLCQLCGIGFVTNSLLTNHIKSHSSRQNIEWT